MKNFKNILHIIITAASLIGFLGGWATLAHARKPGQTSTNLQTQVIDPLPPLDPLPVMNTVSNGSEGNSLSIIVPPSQNNSSNANPVNNSNTPLNPGVNTRRIRPLLNTSGS